jgi:hypothetical protein
MKEQEFLAAVPAPEADERTRMIEGKPYHIVSFENETSRDDFISDVKEKMGLTARPVKEEPIDDEEFLAAVPAPEEDERTLMIEGSPYYVCSFKNEDDRDNFITEVKEKQGLTARPIKPVSIH